MFMMFIKESFLAAFLRNLPIDLKAVIYVK